MSLSTLQVILHIAGVLLVLLAMGDFCHTAFIPHKEGYMTRKISRAVYGVMFRLAGKNGKNPMLNYMGFAIIFFMSLSWIFICWTGFTLIFLSDKSAIIDASTKTHADLWEIVYYVGFNLSTSGLGDFVATTDSWRIVTALASVVGIMLITMSITYLVPVISNMIQKRKTAVYISSLGESPEKIVVRNYDGDKFEGLSDHFVSISELIFEYSQNHLAYPILHYTHNYNTNENIVLKMAGLDEALNIFLFHIPEVKRPNLTHLLTLRRALTQYLMTLKYTDPCDDEPSLPDFEVVSSGIGVDLRNTENEQCKDIYQELSKRRRLWLANIRENGFSWEDIHGTKFDDELDAEPERLNHTFNSSVFNS